ncbi:MAG: hypothetical protein KDD58_01305 [Bdellovibrionales bacterium]|nr:hypothetical protein [Bdellovibrionales bacterium]
MWGPLKIKILLSILSIVFASACSNLQVIDDHKTSSTNLKLINKKTVLDDEVTLENEYSVVGIKNGSRSIASVAEPIKETKKLPKIQVKLIKRK